MITVIYITKGKITGVKVDEKKFVLSEPFELGWNTNTLDMSLSQIISTLKARKIRVLMDDSLSYILRISIPSNLNSQEERRIISDKIQETIPEVLQDRDWDYKDIQFNVSKGRDLNSNREKEVIIFSPVKYVLELLSKAVLKIDVEVEAIEPVQLAITRNSNPMIGISLKDDIKGNDRETLNITIDKSRKINDFRDVLEKNSETTGGTVQKVELSGSNIISGEDMQKEVGKSQGKYVIAGLLIILIVSAMSFLGYFIYRDFIKKDETVETGTAEITETENVIPVAELSPATISEEKIVYKEFKAIIKNGSGISGEAQNAGNLLREIGFEQIDTGNADNYEYYETQVLVSDNLSETAISEIISALSKEYSVATKSGEIGDSEYDLEVIVGMRK